MKEKIGMLEESIKELRKEVETLKRDRLDLWKIISDMANKDEEIVSGSHGFSPKDSA